jgi:hypothetical protein
MGYPKDTEDVIPMKTPGELDAASRHGKVFFLPGMSAVGLVIPTELDVGSLSTRFISRYFTTLILFYHKDTK